MTDRPTTRQLSLSKLAGTTELLAANADALRAEISLALTETATDTLAGLRTARRLTHADLDLECAVRLLTFAQDALMDVARTDP